MPKLSVDSPVGSLTITDKAGAITGLTWGRGGTDETPLLREAAAQLVAYFAKERTEFELPLRVEASPLQRRACDAMRRIPYGETTTYGEMAAELGAPARAVGQACGGNPIAIVIPCHRVLGADGLGGFSGAHGVESKVALLRHEGAAGLLI